jgi:hypothetical protein
MGDGIPNNGDHTYSECKTRKDSKNVKVNAILFAKRAEICAHEIIHINYILT